MLKMAGVNFTFRLPDHNNVHAKAETATTFPVSDRIVVFKKAVKL
jgi:hypothetical protein